MGPAGIRLTVPSGGLLSPRLEAVLYDWHNHHRLRDLSADGPYWAQMLRGARSIAVLGAGTGRVAVALKQADPKRPLILVDRNAARLARVPPHVASESVVADFRRISFARLVDAVLLPYSTFQMLCDAGARDEALAASAALLVDGGLLAIDVSQSFDRRKAHDWTMKLRAPLASAGDAVVEEWERVEREPDTLVVRRRYRVGNQDVGEVTERWAHHSALRLSTTLPAHGLRLMQVQRGYGPNAAPQRHLYLAHRLTAASTLARDA
jgi:hypothetical protein